MDQFPTEVRSFDEVSEALRVLKIALEKVLLRSGNVLVDDIGDGFVCRSPNGTYMLIEVDNAGVVSGTALTGRPD